MENKNKYKDARIVDAVRIGMEEVEYNKILSTPGLVEINDDIVKHEYVCFVQIN